VPGLWSAQVEIRFLTICLILHQIFGFYGFSFTSLTPFCKPPCKKGLEGAYLVFSQR
jgi:hypothetical protein